MHALREKSQAFVIIYLLCFNPLKRGFVQIQNIFLETTNQEKEHAKINRN